MVHTYVDYRKPTSSEPLQTPNSKTTALDAKSQRCDVMFIYMWTFYMVYNDNTPTKCADTPSNKL